MNHVLSIFLTLGIIFMGIIWIITLPEHYRKNPHKIFSIRTLVLCFLVILSVIITLWTALYAPLPPSGNETVLEIIGVILFLAGSLFAVWAKYTMKEFWGGPASQDKKAQTTLLTTGPFAYSRNPIYLGLLLVFAGYTRALHSPAIVLVIIAYVVFNSFIKKEETILEQQFGKKYEEYKKKVPRWIKLS